jgi:HAMP domain-containing protein
MGGRPRDIHPTAGRVTTIRVSELLIVFTLAVLWLASLGLAIFNISRANSAVEVASFGFIFALVLVALGLAFGLSIKRFHGRGLEQQVNSLADKYQSDASPEFSETLKDQLRSSAALRTMMTEVKLLNEEVAAFSAVLHTDEEWETFRGAWQVKAEKLAARAEDDPLAVAIILEAIERESMKGRS